ncbi:MAG: membrane protein insertase YidC, partial [Undibacterium sp.]|nr:membrane protein insertase YidC [Undibacterium sp.]
MDKMDIKRTVLWVIFAMSLLVLFDNWMRHNGKPSLFSPTQKTQQAKNPATSNPATNSASAAASASAVAVDGLASPA